MTEGRSGNKSDGNTLAMVKQVFTEYLASRSLRKTPERFAILEEIYSREGHFDIESLFNFMQDKNYRVSRATLYNTIDLLLDCRLVVRHKFGHNKAQYEKTYRKGPHDHLIDTESGKITEMSDSRIGDLITEVCKENGFIPHHYLLYIYGRPEQDN